MNRYPLHSDNAITASYTCFYRRAVRDKIDNRYPLLLPNRARRRVRSRFSGDHTNPTTQHATMTKEIGEHLFYNIDRDGKGNTSTGGRHRRIDANDLAAHINQRTPTVAGVNRGVNLNEIIKAFTTR